MEISKPELVRLLSSSLPEEDDLLLLHRLINKMNFPIIWEDVVKIKKRQKTSPFKREIIEYLPFVHLWNNLSGVKICYFQRDTKIVEATYQKIDKFLDGTLFEKIADYPQRKFTFEDFCRSIENFKKALSPQYQPRIKKYLRDATLSSFLFSEFTKQMDSLFLRYLETEPPLLAVETSPKNTTLFLRLRDKIKNEQDDSHIYILHTANVLFDLYMEKRLVSLVDIPTYLVYFSKWMDERQPGWQDDPYSLKFPPQKGLRANFTRYLEKVGLLTSKQTDKV